MGEEAEEVEEGAVGRVGVGELVAHQFQQEEATVAPGEGSAPHPDAGGIAGQVRELTTSCLTPGGYNSHS